MQRFFFCLGGSFGVVLCRRAPAGRIEYGSFAREWVIRDGSGGNLTHLFGYWSNRLGKKNDVSR